MKKIEVIIISLSLLISAGILSIGLSKIGRTDRVVTVRGLAEREVDADLAIWRLTFTLGSDNLETLQKTIIEKIQIVKNYLNQYGLTEEDFTVQSPKIQDNSVDRYIDKTKQNFTYIATTVVFVRSNKVENIKRAEADSLNLTSSGIIVGSGYGNAITYDFTGLNDIKPEMIAQATKNARLAAEQFAHDSESKVGKIRNASQGFFSIEDAAAGLEERKKIRVVTTVEYLLK